MRSESFTCARQMSSQPADVPQASAFTTASARSLLGLRWSDVHLDPVVHIRQTLVEYGRVKVTKEPNTERSRRTSPSIPEQSTP